MANKQDKWDYVGSNHVFRKRPPQKQDNSWIGGVIALVFVLFVVSQCAGG